MADAPPSEAALREAAVAHLARYATTGAGLARVLDRRIDRWARIARPEPEQVRAAKAIVRAVVARLVELGAIDDAVFAQSRARSLARGGRSRRAIAAHLAQRGVAPETAAAALPADADAELAAALACALRRRIGPFRRAPVDQPGRLRELAILARAGFAQPVARAALATPAETAEAIVNALRRA
jgi:regulatory protein